MTETDEPIVPKGSADLPLGKRRDIATEQQKEIRQGILNRHLHLREDLCALDRRV